MNTDPSPRAAAFVAGLRRLRLAPLLAFATGVAVPLTLGAMEGGKAPSGTSGKIGMHRLLPNSLLLDHRGEVLVLTYYESESKQKVGMATFVGTIQAVTLREALQRIQKAEGAAESAPARNSAPSGEQRRPADSVRALPSAPRRTP